MRTPTLAYIPQLPRYRKESLSPYNIIYIRPIIFSV
jgi:hypothetical protein